MLLPPLPLPQLQIDRSRRVQTNAGTAEGLKCRMDGQQAERVRERERERESDRAAHTAPAQDAFRRRLRCCNSDFAAVDRSSRFAHRLLLSALLQHASVHSPRPILAVAPVLRFLLRARRWFLDQFRFRVERGGARFSKSRHHSGRVARTPRTISRRA